MRFRRIWVRKDELYGHDLQHPTSNQVTVTWNLADESTKLTTGYQDITTRFGDKDKRVSIMQRKITKQTQI